MLNPCDISMPSAWASGLSQIALPPRMAAPEAQCDRGERAQRASVGVTDWIVFVDSSLQHGWGWALEASIQVTAGLALSEASVGEAEDPRRPSIQGAAADNAAGEACILFV